MSKIKLKNKEPLVTIYITNYNYSKFIEKSIKSALSQTYKNFELFIIDDGSTDNSKKIIEKFSNNQKVRIIYKKRSGLINTNNVAIKIANGEFITRLDADDWLDPNFLNIMVNKALQNKRIAMVFCNYYLTNYKGEITNQFLRHDFNKAKLKDQPAHGACSLIRTNLLKEIGGYDEQFKCQDGVDLWFKLIKKYKVEQINLPLFYYRQHANSLSSNKKEIYKTKNEIIKKHTKNIKNKFKKIIAIIPVRDQHNSKNFIALKKISSTTIIEDILNKIKKIKKIKKIIVTTPDKNIKNHVKKKFKNTVLVEDREKNLARINTPLTMTIESVLKRNKEKKSKNKLIIITNVINPLIKQQDFEAGIDLMNFFDLDSVIGVCKENDLFYRHNGNTLKKIVKSSNLSLERDEIYRQVGGLLIVRSDKIGNSKKIGHIILDKYSSLKITNLEDLNIARFYKKKRLA